MYERFSVKRVASWYLPVLLVSLLVRYLFVAVLPAYAFSWDISSWQRVAALLTTGENPYVVTPLLNWPPLWMICIYVMNRISEATGLEFITVVRLVLIAFESILILVTGFLIERLSPRANVRSILLFGMALNPIAVLLVCQHGNFDVIATTLIAASLLAVVTHLRSNDETDWLLGCSLLGVAVLTKTYPIALTPLLVSGARSVSWRARGLGGALLVGPTGLGMAVLYVLAPEAIARNVLNYRSRSGTFGLSGLAATLDLPLLEKVSQITGTLLVISVFVGVFFAWRWKCPTDRKILLIAALVLLAIPTLGPGFGMQYAMWFMALLVATFASGSPRWRYTVLAAYAVSAPTYFVLYGYASDLGQFMTFLSGSAMEVSFSRFAKEFSGQTWISLPMFVSWVALAYVGLLELRRTPTPELSDGEGSTGT